MKKIMMFLVLCFGVVCVIMAADTTTHLEAAGDAIVKLTLNASSIGDDEGFLRIGFSNATVSDFTEPQAPSNEIGLILTSDRQARALTKSEGINTGYHIFWQIAHSSTVTATLTVSDLKPSAGNSTTEVQEIPLKLKIGGNFLQSENSTGGNAESFTVVSYDSNGTSVGSYEISDIETEAINGNASGNYEATLKLSVSVV